MNSCESYGYNIDRMNEEDDGVYAEPVIYEECRSNIDYKIYY